MTQDNWDDGEVGEFVQAMAGNGWRPIETAPKDGTPILICNPDPEYAGDDGSGLTLEDAPVTMVMGVAAWRKGRWKGYYDAFPPVEGPTHWIPLPATPVRGTT